MMINLQKLSLQSQQQVRALSSATFTTFACPAAFPPAEAARAAGIRYHQEVTRIGRGHTLGSPHIHIAMSLLEEVGNNMAEGEDKQFMVALIKVLGEGGPPVVGELIPYIRLREAYQEDTTMTATTTGGKKRRGEDGMPTGEQKVEGAEEAGQSNGNGKNIIQLQVNPISTVKMAGMTGNETAAKLREIILRAVQGAGGMVLTGTAPQGRAERAVAANLNTNLKKG